MNIFDLPPELYELINYNSLHHKFINKHCDNILYEIDINDNYDVIYHDISTHQHNILAYLIEYSNFKLIEYYDKYSYISNKLIDAIVTYAAYYKKFTLMKRCLKSHYVWHTTAYKYTIWFGKLTH